ncbi:MAG: PQQ-binding-like beta-propeller repeat protein [Verrucomicrobiota bacterium]
MKKLLLTLLLSLPLIGFANDRLIIGAEGGKGVKIIDPAANNKVLWQHPVRAVHDLQLLDSGNILTQSDMQNLIEIAPDQSVVWRYNSATTNGNQGKKVEVHSFQRLNNGHTLIAESGIPRFIEVNSQGKLLKSMPMQVSKAHAHTNTRITRKLDNGNYLVAHEGDQEVKEYSPDGKVVWQFKIPLFDKAPAKGHGPEAWGGKVFSAIKLKNGNYLIATGNGHSVLEVTPEKKIVWHLKQNDIPSVTLAWVTCLQELNNGNFIIGNCHAGPDHPQIIEVNRDKKLLWSYRDFKNFGNALANIIVVDGKRAQQLRQRLAAE